METLDVDSNLASLSKSSSTSILDDLSSGDEIESPHPTSQKEKFEVMFSLAVCAANHYNTHVHKTPCYNREYSGWAALLSILNGNAQRCKNSLHMRIETFFQFCQLLVEDYGLKPMPHVTIEEQVATFLMLVGPRMGNRQCQEAMQRSGFTISKSFHRVLKACTLMSMDWIIPFTNNSVTHEYIRSNDRHYPHFKDCIGAIDGTHIKAALPTELQPRFIGRKQIPTQNILAVCDFDMCFTYVLPGWEGSAHDTRIFYDTIKNPAKKFPMPPPDKYYLVDAGYPNIKGFLAPYKGQKYHLPDFRRAATYTNTYNNEYEMFNHRHSSLRTTIERTFGCWKNRFYMIKDIPVNLRWEDQVALVPATMAIHNFIRKVDKLDEDFLEYDRDPNYLPEDAYSDRNNDNIKGDSIGVNDVGMDSVRDNICTSIAFSRIGVNIY
ncbi:hypothetical protein ACJIZ3_000995 [Penstemon smallii]|uniref:DDE Tnp4 domain-containing protein n=1 Tax=Penstemon smallii TaxID=265156 RepID=A0ABD3U5D9_9LAMI